MFLARESTRSQRYEVRDVPGSGLRRLLMLLNFLLLLEADLACRWHEVDTVGVLADVSHELVLGISRLLRVCVVADRLILEGFQRRLSAELLFEIL